MAMRPKLWSLSAIAVETGRNIRTLSRALRSVPPDGFDRKQPRWFLSTALIALAQHEVASDHLQGRTSNGGHHPARPMLDAIEAATAELDGLLTALRGTPDVEARRAILERRGRAVGRLQQALDRQLAADDARDIFRPFAEGVMRDLLAELLDLCEFRLDRQSVAAQ
jgi:hypothetical protein